MDSIYFCLVMPVTLITAADTLSEINPDPHLYFQLIVPVSPTLTVF